VTITKTRKTYPQNWPAYNEAQQNEKRSFNGYCRVVQHSRNAGSIGRRQRRLPMSDAIFSAVFKVYCTLSAVASPAIFAMRRARDTSKRFRTSIRC